MNAEDRANELYWGSDQSVNQIAAELDLSKGALYEMIRPLPSGLGCPLCGAEVVHPNRTAKERARVDCAACGWDGEEDDAVGPGAPGSNGRSGRARTGTDRKADVEPVDEIYPEDAFDAPGPPPAGFAHSDPELRRMIAGGALLGAAVGLALVIWARRR